MDGTKRLCRALYRRDETPADYLGGADAKMLHDAAQVLESLRAFATTVRTVHLDMGGKHRYALTTKSHAAWTEVVALLER